MPSPRPAPSSASETRRVLEELLRAGLAAVEPEALVARSLDAAAPFDPGRGAAGGPGGERLWVVAVGKAAAPMARAALSRAGARLAEALVVTKSGHALELPRARVFEAGHPVPDARGEAAARVVRDVISRVPEQDVLLLLLSGGASALLSLPLPGLRLEEAAATTRLLLEAGAPIDELNTVRKHLFELAGGRLAARCPASRIEVLAISDVAGDRPDLIGSGPCAPDPSTYGDALAVIEGRRLAPGVPPPVLAHLRAGVRGEREETPKPGDPAFHRVHTRVLASNRTALEAVVGAASARGIRARPLPEALRGEAREAGRRLAALAGALAEPDLLVAGGETTVTVRGTGRGGRCQELALAAAMALAGRPHAALLAAGTDGTDGPTDAAGAVVDGGTVARGERRGLRAADALANNDSYAFFAREGGLLRTGPTRTNVRDLVLLWPSNAPFPAPSKTV